jgi:serine/threonine protein kinase
MDTQIEFLNYTVTEILEEERTWSIYRARHRHLERKVQVVVVQSPNKEVSTQLKTLAAQLFKLQHPYIATLLDFVEVGNILYFIYRDVEGQPLSALLKAKEFKLQEIQTILLQLLHALAHAHQLGLAHGALSPEYIFLDARGSLKILHFGYIARLLKAGEARHPDTYAYVAPELVQHGIADKRSDIYSIGAILYHLLTGKAPIDEKNLDILKIRQNLPAPSSVLARVPAFFDSILQKCMAENPALRYAGVEELEDELVREWNVWLRTQNKDEGSRSRSLLAGFWTLVALAVAASIWIIVQELFAGDSSRPLEEAAAQEQQEASTENQAISENTQAEVNTQPRAEGPNEEIEETNEANEEPAVSTTLLTGTQLQEQLLVDNLYLSSQGGLLEHKVKAVNLNTLQALQDVEIEVRYLDNTGELITSERIVFESIAPGGKAEKVMKKELPREATVEVRPLKATLSTETL